MAQKVIDYGSFVVVEDTHVEHGLFGDREIVNRKRYTKSEWQKEEADRAKGELAGLAIAGLISMGIMVYQGYQEKKDTGFKLPWKK